MTSALDTGPAQEAEPPLPAEPWGQRQDQPQELGEVGHGPGVREGSEGSWGVST